MLCSDLSKIIYGMPVAHIPIAQINNLKELACIYLQTAADWTGVCNCKGRFIRHGTYRRKTPLAGAIFYIQRVICPSCDKTHALIPCFVFPYSWVMAHVKEAAIRGICYETHTIEQLAELCGAEPATVMRWGNVSGQPAAACLIGWPGN
jgi:hypothetical protein